MAGLLRRAKDGGAGGGEVCVWGGGGGGSGVGDGGGEMVREGWENLSQLQQESRS